MKVTLRISFLILCFVSIAQSSFSQQPTANNYMKEFDKIDSLASIAQANKALPILEKLNQQARTQGNAPMLVKSVIYRMLFQSYLKEDAFEEILNDLRKDIRQAKQPEKSILQSLLAETYWKYYQENRYRIANRTMVETKLSDEIGTWSIRQITNETAKTYLSSLSEASLLQKIKVGVFNDILIGDSSNRALRPSLYDLLAHRALDVFMNPQIDISNTDMEGINFDDPIWFSDYKTFSAIKIPQADSSYFSAEALKLFQQLLKLQNQQNNTAALTDIELKRLKFIYGRTADEHKDSLYFNALEALAKTVESNPLHADILFQQAEIYKNGGLQDSSKQNLVKAIALLEKAIKTYPESQGAKNAANSIRVINTETITVQIKQANLPERPIQFLISYKNIDTAHLKLYKIPAAEDESYVDFRNGDAYQLFLKKEKPFRSWSVPLPSLKDYQEHHLSDRMEALPMGNYLLIAQNTFDQKQEEYTNSLNQFRVTALAVNNRSFSEDSTQYIVSNSLSGKFLKNATVLEINERHDPKTLLPYKSTLLKTDENGSVISKQNPNVRKVQISYKGDTLLINASNRYYYYRDEDEKEQVILFTDRPIYRPGQTVFYKGLLIKKKLTKNSIVAGVKLDVSFNDVNGKELEEVSVTTNEYGTFQGSFSIPMGKMNGSMELSTIYGGIQVQVEEYKRPSFEVVFDKSNQKYKLNDSILVKGNATAYSGYAVGAGKVKYTIFRNSRFPYYHYGSRGESTKQIAIGQTETKADGSFSFRFFASTGQTRADLYNYLIKVEVTDINGETRTGTKDINAGYKDLLLDIALPQQLFLSSKADSIPFSITNLNGEPIKATLKSEWFLLESPGRVPNKNPFTIKPEKYTLSKAEFIKAFPNEAYAGDDIPLNWPAQKIDFAQDISAEQGDGNLTLNAKQLSPGFYKVKFNAINEDQERIDVEKVVRIYHPEASAILAEQEWLVAEKTQISPTESAIFRLAGTTSSGTAYYEVYYKNKIVDKMWITVSTKQNIIKISPKAEYQGGFAVQFTLIQNGIVYNSQQTVNIIDPEKALDIKFLTFRNKLQPGEKESWKLRISSKTGEKQMAELAATLYDASLDELKKMDWNKSLEHTYDYSRYSWSSEQNNIRAGHKLWFLHDGDYYFSEIFRKYEDLNLFGYSYYGGGYNPGYRNYLNKINARSISEKGLKRLAELEKGTLLYGVVTDEEGFSLPGVSVKCGKINAVTDAYGIYKINALPGQQIEFRALGFKTFTVKAGKQKRMDVSLRPDGSGLNEVVVTGYAAQKKSLKTASSIVLRGVSTLMGKAAGLVSEAAPAAAVVADEKVYDFVAINAYDPKNNTLIINGKAVRGLDKIVPRTNFNETAFFYPQLHTDKNGEIQIDFTIPQSLTRYKMLGFAHTKDLKTANISRELITQKQLAISANTPRFFREGDTILFTAKLNNLSGKALKGDALLELRDAVTNKVIHIMSAGVKEGQNFEVANKGNEVLRWSLQIPSGIAAITYKIIAQSGKYSDGEEMTIPVLPNGMLLTETMPLNVRGNTSKTFNMEKLLKSGSSKTLKNQSLALEFTANPVWYAVQALPYLMEYPYECAEQTFSRFYANSFATGIINSSPKIKQVFTRWQQEKDGSALLSNLEKNPELKSILLEETPWVKDAGEETARKKRLALLFDLNRMTYELKGNFEKLENMQHSNGAFAWFNGMADDRYITQHIVLGMGQLKRLKMVDEKAYPGFPKMLNKAIIYLDGKLKDDFQREVAGKGTAYLPLHYLYARSYTNQKNNDPLFKKAVAHYLNKVKTGWRSMDAYQRGQAALVLARNGNKPEAMNIVRFLKESARKNEEMGMYWDNNRNGWWWYQSPIETQSLLIEVFDEVANDAESVEEMKIWLLKNKQTNDWKTTKATAAACYSLLLRGTGMLEESATPEISIGNQTLAELGLDDTKKEAGTGYQKLTIAGENVKPEMGKIEVKNNSKTIAWGGVYWQYFEQLDKITPAETGVKIKKELFLQKQSAKGDVLTLLSPTNVLTPGDLLKVRIEIRADRDMEYIHLKDMRSSGFEPVNVISTYKYQDGLGYYESTKDASTNFFISYLRKGVYVFEYALRVSHAGNFSNGITSLQSMYAPEFSTHSAGIRVTVKPQ
ncbi:CarboxypepD_reg-like domain-containing protein [Pedobacter steynii]|uniref:CarboxypepD_reg-like domain-containing protein n=1 Tax=Pedobacter steynii TaxID=430522 RepID=A0A1H0LKR9_9SPHI|nr:alpha-2-macroglobulin family protein [Pedobacter steynii]NQX43499.1 carboxypeptidase-like regulatory domain-containing protein [Pedobacter steynii]SDO68490.1 CarboxypepD_reg-like domain-containing protein [Pedobacter steynii]